ncbi:sulfite exporter TauE/SafE family protein [Salinimicrobium soli]
MDLIEIFGYLGGLLIGLVLGLIGGGGSILTVPVLVYLLSVNPVTATAYSLFVVGTSSLVGAARNMQKKRIGFRTALAFAIPAVISVFSTRKFLVPAIPEEIFRIEDFIFTKDIAIMIFFAVLMLLASFSMILDREKLLEEIKEPLKPNYQLLIPLGFGTGLVTGLVGAGGGFIIIPILVLLAGLPMKKAVGTSLFIIALNSLLGFLGDLGHQPIDWPFLLFFTFLAVLGIFLGVYLNKFIDGKKLKKGFGWFVLVMGIYILWKELF